MRPLYFIFFLHILFVCSPKKDLQDWNPSRHCSSTHFIGNNSLFSNFNLAHITALWMMAVGISHTKAPVQCSLSWFAAFIPPKHLYCHPNWNETSTHNTAQHTVDRHDTLWSNRCQYHRTVLLFAIYYNGVWVWPILLLLHIYLIALIRNTMHNSNDEKKRRIIKKKLL